MNNDHSPTIDGAANAVRNSLANRLSGCKPGKTHNFITYTTSSSDDPDNSHIDSIRCHWCNTHAADSPGYTGDEANSCPRCHNDQPHELDREDLARHKAFRCRACGHIFGEKWGRLMSAAEIRALEENPPYAAANPELGIDSPIEPVRFVVCGSGAERHNLIHVQTDQCIAAVLSE